MSLPSRSFQVTGVTSDNAGTLGSQSGRSSQGNSSHPSSPSLFRRSSRFRVIRLAAGPAEPYHRGRWTCRDFLESEEGVGLRRMMESMRQAHSLESLEVIRRLPVQKGGGLNVHSQRPIRTEMRPVIGQPIRLPHLDNNWSTEDSGLSPWLCNTPAHLFDQKDKSDRVPPPRPEHGLFNPSQSGAGLDRTIFSFLGESSEAGAELNNIDTKIQQAMDLVKGHLQLAIKEELVGLQQQITELQDRNNQLQRENYALRSLLKTR